MGDVPRDSGLGRLPGRQLCGWHTQRSRERAALRTQGRGAGTPGAHGP